MGHASPPHGGCSPPARTVETQRTGTEQNDTPAKALRVYELGCSLAPALEIAHRLDAKLHIMYRSVRQQGAIKTPGATGLLSPTQTRGGGSRRVHHTAHRYTVPSSLAEASHRMSGDQATSQIPAFWPCNETSFLRVDVSHTRTAPSPPPAASIVWSAAHAMG